MRAIFFELFPVHRNNAVEGAALRALATLRDAHSKFQSIDFLRLHSKAPNPNMRAQLFATGFSPRERPPMTNTTPACSWRLGGAPRQR
jgi:hypothetical protein